VSQILVAGIGNIFKGDDAFGVEVAQRLKRRTLPPDVEVIDFGIRGIDLTYALLDGYSSAVLIDAAKRGGQPGTLYVIEPDQLTGDPAPEDLMMSPHDLDPARVLRVAAALGASCDHIILVACEPLTFGDDQEGYMGLSAPVAAAVDVAVGVVEQVLQDVLAPAASLIAGNLAAD
jgi:hydrogenase maturation protease